jgi:hypothetical protein
MRDLPLDVEQLETMCERITGRNVAQWEDHQGRALMRAVDDGTVRSGKRLTADAMTGWMRAYGFDPEDFEATFLPDHDGRRHLEFRLVPGRFPF